ALPDEGLMHHSEHGPSRTGKGDQCAPCRHAGDERFGPVDRVKHPDEFGIAAFGSEFLADDPVSGELLADQCAHRLLGRTFRCSHGIKPAAAALILDTERGAKERLNGFPRYRRKLADKTFKIHRSHLCVPFTPARWKALAGPRWLGPWNDGVARGRV